MIRRKFRNKKFSFLMAMLLVLSGLFSAVAYAQESDTRTVINTIVATSDTDNIPGYGKNIYVPKFTIKEGAPAKFEYRTGAWYKKVDGKWNENPDSSFGEGIYQYKIQVRIDGNDGKTYVLDEKGINITVDGKSWGKNRNVNLSNDVSYSWATSPEYSISKPAKTEITDTLIPVSDFNKTYNCI